MFPVIEYIKTIINGMKMFVGTAISKAIKSSTADWNQNDQNTPDYVKNRTHYTFVDKCFVDMLSGSFDFTYAGLYYCATIPCGQPLLEESEYKMVWNGEEYVFPCKNYKNSLYFGNITYGYSTEIRPPAESDDAPFLVVMTPGDGKIDVYKEGGGTADITLSVRRKKTIKLDEKYIPDSIARDAKVLHPGDPLEVEKLSVGPDGTDTLSPYSVAVGRPLETGRKSLAVGDRVKSRGEGSFAQGQTTSAFGTYSHAQGHSTLARGTGAHAEGDSTSAWGDYSHAEGHATYAGSSYQHAFGRYNVVDSTSKYIQIAGNGKASSLSNAYTLDWDGNGWFAGDVFVGGASQDEGVKLLKAGEAIPIPQTASVGQTVVVKAVDENGKPTEWEPVTLPEQVQADWNQNDSSAADYVKNRTHYEESEYVDYVLNMDETVIVGFSMPGVGETTTVKINGVESVETVKEAESSLIGISYKYIGNTDLDSLINGGTGWLVVDVQGEVFGYANPDTTVAIESLVVHKINDKFINFDGFVRTFDYYFVDYTLYKRLYKDDGSECVLYMCNNIILPKSNSQLFGFMAETGFSYVSSIRGQSCFVTGYIISSVDGSINIQYTVLGTNTTEMEELAAEYGFTHTTNPKA